VSAAVALGQPGLSFRYVETFGVTEQAYIADVQHLNRPNGLFVDGSDNLYVVEDWGSRMLKYRTSDGNNLLSIGVAGLHNRAQYSFDHPQDVAVDNSGNIWVVDRHRAAQYDASGSFLQELPPDDPWNRGSDNTHFDTPRGIAFDSAGRMYVSDSENHRVQVYTFVGGSPVYSTTIGVTGVSGNDNAHFNWPARIVIDSSDRLYVADVENFRVQRCTYAAGWTCATFDGTGSEGSGSNELSWAYGLGIDSSDNIYIADGGNARVKKCDSGGSCSTFASGFEWPADVAVDSAGNVYVSDFFECTIRKYNSSGNFLGIFAGTSDVPYLTDNSHFNAPYGVAVDSSGNIYLSTRRGYRVLKLNASGAAQWSVGTAGVPGNDNVHFGDWWDGPDNVAVDASGNVYVADTAIPATIASKSTTAAVAM
jgi:sugar lactone lactonase YvrE